MLRNVQVDSQAPMNEDVVTPNVIPCAAKATENTFVPISISYCMINQVIISIVFLSRMMMEMDSKFGNDPSSPTFSIGTLES